MEEENRMRANTLEKLYIRWCLGLERCAPRYIILEVTKMEKVKMRAGQRAMKYSERIRNTTSMKILKET